ncbi:hypothetical protein N7462_002645 [Penicillium macrosclerotiorum]|uniref:uncharacterized protein n=1 Tax=Penicillium macrosclerotiorum TaxID=303699 RepID=UPI002549BEA7|nr:uncharacterized protein N7462_002645 [Penicillium macrosclerotiorum]KAJ5693222.1 hypothetical protein N7462_002645 [Penicillium macrosclerotiorum]
MAGCLVGVVSNGIEGQPSPLAKDPKFACVASTLGPQPQPIMESSQKMCRLLRSNRTILPPRNTRRRGPVLHSGTTRARNMRRIEKRINMHEQRITRLAQAIYGPPFPA